MAANTITLVRSEFTLAGPVSTTTVHPASQSLARRIELNARVHQAHVRAHIRRLQSLGRGLPSSTRGPQRRTRAVAHTITTSARTATTPAARRPLAAIILNGLSTSAVTTAPVSQAEVAERPLLVTRRSDVFEDDSEEPLFTPRVPEDGARRTPGAPANTNGSGDYFPAPPPSPAPVDLEDVELEEEEKGREERATV